MKKISILLFGLILHFSCFAQSFPTSNAIWNEFYHDSRITPTNQYITYGLFGDTIINNILYNKLYTLSDTVASFESLLEYAGGFRQDEGKVFFMPGNCWNYYLVHNQILQPDIEILLYDFSANVGDTVWFYEHGGEYCIIKNIEINNSVRAYTIETHYGGGIWHEGMGNNRGLFGHLCGLPLSGVNWSTVCFKHNDTIKYLNKNYCNQCFCIGNSSINEIVNFDIINIYPNPAKDILTIEMTENIVLKSISIHTIDGKLIVKNKYSFEDNQINIEKLQTGTYIITIETNKSNLNKLIIKN